MLNSLSSNAISAKARAIYGKRLTQNDYHELLRKTSVAGVTEYLKSSTAYSQYLSGINELTVHRGQLESLLNRSLFYKFSSLCYYDFSRKKGFYRYMILNFETKVLLHAIMLLNSGSLESIITDLPVFVQEFASFDFQALAKIQSFDELLRVLEKTAYAKILKPHRAENGEINLSNCEYVLKKHYYDTLLGLVDENYKGKIRNEVREIVLIDAELLNLSIIFRMRKYFKRQPGDVKAHILPFYFKLSKSSIDRLLEATNTEDFVSRMKLSIYSSKIDSSEFKYIEDYTKRLRYMISGRRMRASQTAPIVFFTLMTLMDIEIDNIIMIIEGIRYGYSPAEIEKILII